MDSENDDKLKHLTNAYTYRMDNETDRENDDKLKHLTNVRLDNFTSNLTFGSKELNENTRKAFGVQEGKKASSADTVVEKSFTKVDEIQEKTLDAIPNELEKCVEIEEIERTDNEAKKSDGDDDLNPEDDISRELTTSNLDEADLASAIGDELVSAIMHVLDPCPDVNEEKQQQQQKEKQPPQEKPKKGKSRQSSQDAEILADSMTCSSLGLLASQYDSNSSDDDSEREQFSDPIEIIGETSTNEKEYRVVEIDSDTSSDSDIEIVSQSDLQKIIDVDMLDDEEETSKHKGPIRVKGELLLDDLPPIQDLHITVSENECAELGKVHSIVDQLVLVDSIPGTVALDLDTILFLEKGQKVLGEVFDVLGQVATPIYCVRFNSNKQIKEKEIEVGQTVYIAPRTDHTRFVILPELLKIRGSDASWENDVEPTDKHIDYSDDEDERQARRSNRNKDRSDDMVEGGAKRQRATPEHSRNPGSNQTPRQNYQRNRYNQRFPQQQAQQQQNTGQYPFNYNASNASWHTNYNRPPIGLPNPYARSPYIPPEAMQQVLFPPPPAPPGE